MELKTLIHVNEAARWKVALANITNLLNDPEAANVTVLVVVNGEGVKGYVSCSSEGTDKGSCSLDTTDNMTKMKTLSDKGVRFLACNNALKANNISPESLPGFVSVIPAGMTELIKRQAEGFAYIKP